MIVYALTSDSKHRVKVIGQSVDVVIHCRQFQSWLDDFEFEFMDLRLINIQSADIFEGGKVIFVKMETEVLDRQRDTVTANIVYLRGNSVTSLVFVECIETGKIFVLTVNQPRIPVGKYSFQEILAGTMDKNDGISGRMVSELYEEARIKIRSKDLRPLGVFVPSTGGCDERIDCFFAKKRLRRKKINDILSRVHGAEGENEFIRLRLLTIPEFVQSLADGDITDGKAFSATMLLLLKEYPKAIIWLLKKIGKNQIQRKRVRR